MCSDVKRRKWIPNEKARQSFLDQAEDLQKISVSGSISLKEPTEKEWWAPVWKGLVMDSGAAHFKKMGNAVWLFLYFLLNANRSTGGLVRKVKTISSDTGIPRRTVFQWLNVLRKGRYITTKSSGRFLIVEVQKWKSLREVQEKAHQKCQTLHSRGAKNGTSQTTFEGQKTPETKENSESESLPKKNTIKENILKRRFDKIDFKNMVSTFKTKEELLAYDLAQALQDLPGFPLYLSYSRKYPEAFLREILGKVREIPSEKIKTSRGALFNFLIQQHGKNASSPRHQPRNTLFGLGHLPRESAYRLEN